MLFLIDLLLQMPESLCFAYTSSDVSAEFVLIKLSEIKWMGIFNVRRVKTRLHHGIQCKGKNKNMLFY